MAVRQHIPEEVTVWQCQDGWFSNHNRRGACHRHGGVVREVTLFISPSRSTGGGSAQLDVVDVPLSLIRLNPEWFQNRAAAYSSRSVDNIVSAVKDGTFRWANLDPVTMWHNPEDGQLYILGGHSREEAFNRLCAMQATAEGKGFCAIPAKVFEGSYEEARRIAMESNTLSTKETDLERAGYYRRLRLDDEMPLSQIKATVQRLEGRNANTILAYSFLNPQGKTWAALVALDEGQDTSRTVITNVARWIGNARIKYPGLSNFHEDELYAWLVLQKGYGTSSGQINRETDFQIRLASIINRRFAGDIDPHTPLNIQNLLHKSPTEAAYDAQIEEARAQVSHLEKELKDQVNDLARRCATETDIRRITAGLEASLTRARIEYQNLLAQKGRILEAAKQERGLFDEISGICRMKCQKYRQMPAYLTI